MRLLTNGILFVLSFQLALAEFHDYCMFDVMNITCADDELLNFVSARYGRMRLGTCITKDYGFVGCSGNVLDIMDGRCSGRRSCIVDVVALIDRQQPCPFDLQSYLEVNYTCVKVHQDSDDCSSAAYVNLTHDQPVFVSFLNSARLKSPSPRCPLVISASRGQRINVTLTDFDSWQGVGPSKQRQANCAARAIIRESGSDVANIAMCGLCDRQVSPYTSHGDTITLHFLFTSKVTAAASTSSASASNSQGNTNSNKLRNLIFEFSVTLPEAGPATAFYPSTFPESDAYAIALTAILAILIVAVLVGVIVVHKFFIVKRKPRCRPRQMSEVMRVLNPQAHAASSTFGSTHGGNEMAAAEGDISESNVDNSPGYLQPLVHADSSNYNYLTPIAGSGTMERNLVLSADNYLPHHRNAAGAQGHAGIGPAADVATNRTSVESDCIDFNLPSRHYEYLHAYLNTGKQETATSSYLHLNLSKGKHESGDYTQLDLLDRNVTNFN